MFIAWTTVAARADAERLAAEAVRSQLAVCVQIDGPLASLYVWEGQLERSEEFRLTFKCLPEHVPALESLMLANHPYKVPEWLVVQADRVGEKYLSWANANSSNPPL